MGYSCFRRARASGGRAGNSWLGPSIRAGPSGRLWVRWWFGATDRAWPILLVRNGQTGFSALQIVRCSPLLTGHLPWFCYAREVILWRCRLLRACTVRLCMRSLLPRYSLLRTCVWAGGNSFILTILLDLGDIIAARSSGCLAINVPLSPISSLNIDPPSPIPPRIPTFLNHAGVFLFETGIPGVTRTGIGGAQPSQAHPSPRPSEGGADLHVLRGRLDDARDLQASHLTRAKSKRFHS